MTIVSRLTAAGGAALALGALGATAASAAPAHHATKAKHHPAKQHRAQQHGKHGSRPVASAVFVQNDNPNGNTVFSYDRAPSGKLTRAGAFPTGGKGGVLGGSVVDHLASQGSLTLDRAHDLLYAVNAGSDTVTVFGVHGDKLTRQQVLPSGGSFPVSVAVRGDTVYVLNVRNGGALQGFHVRDGKLAPIAGSNRALGLPAPASTAAEFTSTPGQALFSPNGRQLVVTTKGDGNDIDVFTVKGDGSVSAKPVVNAEGANAPFDAAFDAHGHLTVIEGGPNAVATFSLGVGGQATGIAQTLTGQMATCWIVFAGGHAFAASAGSNTIAGFDVGADGSIHALGTTRTDAGPVDEAVSPDGKFLYDQTGARGIVDEFGVQKDGSLHQVGSVTVPGAVGGEGIAVS